MNLPEPTRAPESFRDWRVALVGAGIEGRDAARFLQQEGSRRCTSSTVGRPT